MILLFKLYILFGLFAFLIEMQLTELEFNHDESFWEGINPAIIILWLPKVVINRFKG